MDRLFEPNKIGEMLLSNCMVMPAMTTNLGTPDGLVSEKLKNYYRERARGGVGLLIVEGKLRLEEDNLIPQLRELVQTLQAQGARVGIQLLQKRKLTEIKRDQALALLSRFIGNMTQVEIETLQEVYALVAKRAQEAGFDTVEISAAHGSLPCLFLSRAVNQRTDKYGKGLEGRTRFMIEVLERVKKRVGKEYPLIIRINAEDFEAGGNSIEDTKVIAQRLEAAGANALNLSAGIEYTSPQRCVSPKHFQPGWLAPYAEKIKRGIRIPVIVASRIAEPGLARNILQQGQADLVAMGRALIADPQLLRKTREGRLEDIQRCIACQGCYGEVVKQREITCVVNPRVGKEGEASGEAETSAVAAGLQNQG